MHEQSINQSKYPPRINLNPKRKLLKIASSQRRYELTQKKFIYKNKSERN